jgi:branched-chain amino acid transport system ATP-binding protein
VHRKSRYVAGGSAAADFSWRSEPDRRPSAPVGGMRKILELDGISKRFGALLAMENLSAHLNEGEALGVIGPNGSGKTTMFNIITGITRADSGRVFLEGTEITRLPAFERCRRGIARSFQIPHPFAGMTVFENLLVGAAFGDGKPERAAYDRCVEILRETGLFAKSNVRAGTLTLLDRKRLELARALATNPRVLLLDEIAGGLTEKECRLLVEEIGRIRERGVSIIWIEHVVHALLAVVDRLLVINFGRMIDDGDPHKIIASRAVKDIYMGQEDDTIQPA